MTATTAAGAREHEYTIDVFPMMQPRMGYWWAVSDERGHICKLGRTDTEAEAQDAASDWLLGAVTREGRA